MAIESTAAVTKVGDSELRFRVVTLAEAASFCSQFWQRRRATLVEELKAVGASQEQIASEVATLLPERGLASSLIRDAFQIENAREILKLCLADGEASEIESIGIDEVAEIAVACLGQRLETDDGDDEGK